MVCGRVGDKRTDGGPMLRSAFTLATLALLFGAPTTFRPAALSAQDSPGTLDPEWYKLYEDSKKSPATAGVLEYVCPFAGYLYAGDMRRGLVPNLLKFGGIFLVVASIGCSQDGPPIPGETEERGCEGRETLATIGALSVLTGFIWGTVDAYDTAKDYNRALLDRLSLQAVGRNGRAGLQLQVRF